MELYIINDIKKITKKLFSDSETAFDQFLVSDCTITTNATYTIDGHINKEFYSEEEISQFILDAESKGRIYSEEMIRWESVKSFCFSIIKGKKTPLSFKIVLCLAPENIDKFLKSSALSDSSITRADISALVINIKYDGSALTITTGTSLKIFSLDKSVEKAWDTMVAKFLTSLDIPYDV